MKKTLKIIGFVLLTIIILLIAAPFIFESQLKDLVKETINKNVDAQVEFSDIDLSMFRSFPQATLIIKDFSMVNNAPFQGDTLATGEEVVLEMSVKELFKSSGEPKRIDELILNNAFVNIKIDSLGNANYDIVKEIPKDIPTADTSSTAFSLDLKHYEINNSRVKYLDESSKITLDIQELNHEGTGDFSLEESELDTKSQALVSLDFDGVNYLNKHSLVLDAIFNMDLEKMRYTFKENEARLNQLPLTFDGYVQVNEDNNELDISFKTPSSDFKNFLAIIPETYAKNIENVDTKGDFIVNGRINGIVDATHIPQMGVKISSDNASFKYPDLPKSVQDINIDLELINQTGLAADTYITFNNLTFRIDQDRFAASGSIKNLTENMLVNMVLKGTVNLANISKAYPLELEQDLNGILNADIKTSFDMDAIENEQYQNVNSTGTASLRNFSYKSPEIPNEIKIADANFNFNQGNVSVTELNLTTGQTDLKASGSIQNLMGFLLTEQQLKGNFKVNSNTFSVNDFMIAKTEEIKAETEEGTQKTVAKTTGPEAVKIPSFLDVELAFTANRILYDNLELKNAKGVLIIRDETARLQNITTNIFEGSIGLNGLVSTKNPTPVFEMNLDLNSLDIASSFNGLELMQNIAPIAKALEGKLQTTLNLKGNLNNDLTPQLASLAGNALAEILTAEINPEKTPLLAGLNNQLNFINLDKLNLDKLKTQLTFNNGSVEIAPFNFNVKGINVQVAGTHGFDMAMNYNVTMDIPAKYLGSQIGNTLGQLSGESIQDMTVALPIGLTGSFQSPKINLDMQQAVTNLTQRIVEKQKAGLQEKGKDALIGILTGKKGQKDSIGGIDSTKTRVPVQKDSINKTQQEEVKNVARDILGGILKGNKKKTDTSKNNN